MALSNVVMECLRFVGKPPWSGGMGVSWPWAPSFLDKVEQAVSDGSQFIRGWHLQREGEGEGLERERERERVGLYLPLNTLTLSSTRTTTKSPSEFPQSPCSSGYLRVFCQYRTLPDCRVTKNWVSTPRSASCSAISVDQAALSLADRIFDRKRLVWLVACVLQDSEYFQPDASDLPQIQTSLYASQSCPLPRQKAERARPGDCSREVGL